MYEKTVSDISKSLRAMAKRVRRAEAQLSRRRGIPVGTTAEREANEQSQLWWDTDLDAFMGNFGNGWEPVKDVRTGTTAQRASYPGSNAGEFWWDTDEERLYAWDGHSWESTDIAESGTTTERNASSPVNGQWWLDTDDGFTYVYDGIEWKAPTSSRYIEPWLLLSETYGLFPFVPFHRLTIQPLPDDPVTQYYSFVNIMDYAQYYAGTSDPGTQNLYRMEYYNSPAHGDNGHIPYLNFVASSSQYCDTKNYGATGDLALLAWVSPDTASNIMPIIDKWYEVSGDRCYRLVLWSDNTFRFYVSDDGVTGSYYVSTPVLTDNELLGWNFIAVRFDTSGTLKIFHNGAWTSFGGSVPASIHDYDNNILFGKSNAASPVYFDGQMSVVAICKSAINDEIVEYIYESTKQSYIPQPEPQTSDSVSVGEYAYISLEDISWMIRPRESEHISVSESISMFGLTNPNTSENVSVSESVGVSDIANPSTSDGVNVTENIGVYCSEIGTLEVNVSDNTSISESVETVCSICMDISDNISVSENVATYASKVLEITVDDSVGVSDSVDADGIPNIMASESVSVSESTDVYYPQLGTLAMSVSDGIAVTENVFIEDIPNITASESVSVSENVDAYCPELSVRSIDVSDSVPVTESSDVDYISEATTSDSISVSEYVDADVSVLGVITPSTSDNISITESVDVDGIPNISTSDPTSVSEYVDVSRLEVETLASSVSDSISLSESENVSITGALPSAINKVNYLLTDNEYFYANYWSRTYPYWTTAWIEPSYLHTNNGYFSANYWPRRYKYWAIAP